MNLTYQQEQNFRNTVANAMNINTSLLEDMLEWIKNNLQPDDVFSVKELEDWALDCGFIKEEK